NPSTPSAKSRAASRSAAAPAPPLANAKVSKTARTSETDVAELLVVNELNVLRFHALAAGRAGRVTVRLHLAELEVESIEVQKAARKRPPLPQQDLDGLHSLERTDDTAQDPQHTGLLARRRHVRRRGRRILAAVAALSGDERHHLPLEAVDAPVNDR